MCSSQESVKLYDKSVDLQEVVDEDREPEGLKLTRLLHVEGKYMAYKFLLPW